MLDQYVAQTQQLLQLPQAPTALYPEADIISYINRARRGQIAGESEAIRAIGTIDTVVDQRPYNFADIDTGVSATNGIAGVLNVRRINYDVGSGQRQLTTRGWEWFDFYELNNPVPVSSYPKVWSQYKQGGAPSDIGVADGGSFYISPPPDAIYTLRCDCVCYPIALEDDDTVEALPFPWTDAVPYYAAYLALMSAQSNARIADAERIFNQYTMFVERARKFSNPSLLRTQYSQAVDPAQINKLGVRQPPQGGAQ